MNTSIRTTKYTAVCALVIGSAISYGSAHADGGVEVIFHSGAPGGGYMTFANMFSSSWENEIPGFVASTVQGAGLTNVVRVEQSADARDIGVSFNTILMDALNHQETFERLLDGPIENLRAVARLNDTAPFLAPTLSSDVPEGVTTMGEFLATEPTLSLVTKERGSGGEEFTRRILDLYGYGYDTIRQNGGSVTFTSTSDGITAMVNGHANASWQSYLPHAAVLQELESSRDVSYLSLDDDILEQLETQYGYLPFTAPADWFSTGQEVATARQDSIVYVHQDLDEDTVYEMTRIMLENKDRWVRGQRNFESFEPENAWRDTIIELHPGAVRAYQDLGFMADHTN
jgi:uncharacterized protein